VLQNIALDSEDSSLWG